MFSTFGDKETNDYRMKKIKSQELIKKERVSLRNLRKVKSKREMRQPLICRETASTRLKQRDPHRDQEGACRQLMISNDFYFNRRLTLEKKSDRSKSLQKPRSMKRFGSRLRYQQLEVVEQPKKGLPNIQKSQSLKGIFISRNSNPINV
jgi:hypothetical protein